MKPKKKQLAPRSREITLRRTLARRGYELKKSRTRDPLALEYGLWQIVDPRNGAILALEKELDSIARWVADMKRPRGEVKETVVDFPPPMEARIAEDARKAGRTFEEQVLYLVKFGLALVDKKPAGKRGG